jgi:predicted RNA-binding Zn-ribbon protein involved in translation (DUF1610 family)
MKTTFTVCYYNGKGKFTHSYDATWERTEYFCPVCGKQTVWQRKDGWDIEQGDQYQCTSCGAEWFTMGFDGRQENKNPKDADAQVLTALRKAEKEGDAN